MDKGYYVIIPDMRGYNTSDKPEGIITYTNRRYWSSLIRILAESSYHMDYLVADVITLIDTFAGANNKALVSLIL